MISDDTSQRCHRPMSLRSNPVQSRPIPSNPVQSRPIPSNPVQSRPIPSNPVQSRPIPSNPVQSSAPKPPPTAPLSAQPAYYRSLSQSDRSNPVQSRPIRARSSAPKPPPTAPLSAQPAYYRSLSQSDRLYSGSIAAQAIERSQLLHRRRWQLGDQEIPTSNAPRSCATVGSATVLSELQGDNQSHAKNPEYPEKRVTGRRPVDPKGRRS